MNYFIHCVISIIKIIIFFKIQTIKNVNGQEISEDLLNHYKPLESFVELKGGEFLMGVNDKHGVNFEYPQRLAKVLPFRF